MKPQRPQYVVDRHGKKTAVILPVKQYEQILEDLHDLAVVAERRRGRTGGVGKRKTAASRRWPHIRSSSNPRLKKIYVTFPDQLLPAYMKRLRNWGPTFFQCRPLSYVRPNTCIVSALATIELFMKWMNEKCR